jgi:hypothetical protein
MGLVDVEFDNVGLELLLEFLELVGDMVEGGIRWRGRRGR